VFVVAFSVNNVASSTGQVPERDTTEMAFFSKFANKILHVLRLKITPIWRSICASRETDIQLGFFAGIARLNDFNPLVVVEPFAFKTFGHSITPTVVIKLNKKGIELG